MAITPVYRNYGLSYGTTGTGSGTSRTGGDVFRAQWPGNPALNENDRKQSASIQFPATGRGQAAAEYLPGKEHLEEEWKKRAGLEDPTEECQTCKRRKYQDGSDEMVSFKTPQHISPENAASAVRAHEQEHVSNAYKKAATKNGKVISASVSIHTAVCPECGRTYVSGGTTHTQIKYYNEDNPYQQDLKKGDWTKYAGMNLDYAV